MKQENGSVHRTHLLQNRWFSGGILSLSLSLWKAEACRWIVKNSLSKNDRQQSLMTPLWEVVNDNRNNRRCSKNRPVEEIENSGQTFKGNTKNTPYRYLHQFECSQWRGWITNESSGLLTPYYQSSNDDRTNLSDWNISPNGRLRYFEPGFSPNWHMNSITSNSTSLNLISLL